MSDGILTSDPVSIRMRAWVIVCVLGVFGPYVVSGARTEQLVIYGSAAAIVVTQLPRLGRLLRPAAVVLGLWLAYSIVVVAGGLLLSNRMPWPSGSLVAGVDNALLPLASIVTFTFFTRSMGSEPLVRLVSWVVAGAMGLNAVVALVTNFFGLHAVPGLGHFWAAGGYDGSVAVLSEQMGRFSGIFNQPAEAGVAYSLAVLAILYLARVDDEAPKWVLWALMSLAIVGGLLTLSKVFVVGGLALALVLALTDKRNRRRTVSVGALTLLAVAVLGAVNLVGSWGATIMFSWYRSSFAAGDSFFYTLSAGRFGAAGTTGAPSISPPALPSLPSVPASGATGDVGGSVSGSPSAGVEQVPLPTGIGDVARQIFDHQPTFGVGARGLEIAYDSSWAESLVVGGLVGLVLIVAVHAALAARWVSVRRVQPRATWLFAGAVVVLTLGASFGLPALTGNRESTLLWMFLVPLVIAYRPLTTARSGSARVVERRDAVPARSRS